MSKRIWTMLLIAILSISIMAGCSKNDSKTVEEEKENQQTEAMTQDQEEMDLPEHVDPNKVDLMNELASESAKEDDFLIQVRAKGGDWHNVELIFTDEYAEKLSDMSASERESELKSYRKVVYEDLAKSNVLFYESKDDTIIFHYLNESEEEFIDKTEVKPD